MFQSTNPEELRDEIDVFQVPMFAADRHEPGGPFRLMCINKAHERLSGMQHDAVTGRSPFDFLPPEQAKSVTDHYARCADTGKSQRYQEVLDMAEGPIMWDTTLQPISMADGRKRVLGNAVFLKHVSKPHGEHIAFEDVQYFSAQAAFQLSQVSAYLDAVECGDLAPSQIHGSIAAVAGICRSIDRALNDIRAVADTQISKTAIREEMFLLSDDASAISSKRPNIERSLTNLSRVIRGDFRDGQVRHTA